VRDARRNYPAIILEQRNPITIESDNIIVAGDWHIPFYDDALLDSLLLVKEEYGVKDIAIPGDLWDCDNLSQYTKIVNTCSFDDEAREVGVVLRLLIQEFDRVFICRGNHEKRWMDIKGGFSVQALFQLSGVPSIDPVTEQPLYHLTTDDHMHLVQNGEKWLLCHPRTYRQVPLSVVRDLASIHGMHVFGAHGHQLAQGVDRSGRYNVVDGGGMFDKASLDYLRETTTHPETRPGFYLIQDNAPRAFSYGL